jgi:hypothetical protein
VALLVAVGLVFPVWRVVDHARAVREVEGRRGFSYAESSLWTRIQKDWRAAFRAETWEPSVQKLAINGVKDLASERRLIERLRPTSLSVVDCGHLESLDGLPGLDRLYLRGERLPRNLSGLKKLTWSMGDSTSLEGVETLESLKSVVFDATNVPLLEMKRLIGLRQLRDVSFGLSYQYWEYQKTMAAMEAAPEWAEFRRKRPEVAVITRSVP